MALKPKISKLQTLLRWEENQRFIRVEGRTPREINVHREVASLSAPARMNTSLRVGQFLRGNRETRHRKAIRQKIYHKILTFKAPKPKRRNPGSQVRPIRGPIGATEDFS